jgi:hypothetical protein
MTGSVDTLSAGMTKVNDIIDDLASTDNGLGASCIGIEDSAGNMSATNVEDALAEIYTDFSTTRTLAETLDEDPDSTVDLTWGYTAGVIRYGTTVTSIAAGTVLLTDDATNYVEVNSSGTVSANTTSFTAGRMPLRIVVASGGAQTTSTDKRAWYVGATSYQSAPLTNHGILVASGTDNFKSLGAATNGQLPIGSTGADPVLAALTGTADQITVTNGAGTITLSTPQSINTTSSPQFAGVTLGNEGLHLLDTNASHDLIIKPGSDLTADRIFTITTGDAARTLSMAGNLTVTNTGIAMIGDGGTTKAYFYQNTAPTGWTIDATPADALLAVKGGSAAYNANGGTQQGTWTQPNHLHSTGDVTLTAAQSGVPAHTHPHTHTVSYGSADVGTVKAAFVENNTETGTMNTGTDATANATAAAAEAHNHGNTGNGATANTWRPLAQVGIICTLNA